MQRYTKISDKYAEPTILLMFLWFINVHQVTIKYASKENHKMEQKKYKPTSVKQQNKTPV